MRRVMLGLVTMLVALLLSWDGGTQLSVSKANAVIGRPGTPGSFAGVHRRVMRRIIRFREDCATVFTAVMLNTAR